MSTETEKNFVPVTVTVQPEIVELMDKIVEQRHLSGRSELVRQAFGCFLKQLLNETHPSSAGIYADASGTPVHIGLLTDEGKKRVESGEWKLIKDF
jgi:Arc/MetJ-type ribon-helix-helix transcriptional regulator